eukprot:IDg14004t1
MITPILASLENNNRRATTVHTWSRGRQVLEKYSHLRPACNTCIRRYVLHVSDLLYQLLSVPAMEKLGLKTSFRHGRYYIKSESNTTAQENLRRGLYHLELADRNIDRTMVVSIYRWHERLAHVEEAAIKQAVY